MGFVDREPSAYDVAVEDVRGMLDGLVDSVAEKHGIDEGEAEGAIARAAITYVANYYGGRGADELETDIHNLIIAHDLR